MKRISRAGFAGVAALIVTVGAATTAHGQCQAIIHNTTTVKLGVDCYGQLNVFVDPSDPNAVPSMVVGTTSVGVRYMPLGIGGPEAEATSHGCFCEGWGIAATSPAFSARANNAWGSVGLVSNSFTSTLSTAVADCGTVGGEVRVVHDFRPSATPNLFEVLVTITNTTTSPMTGIKYRRNMDWDVEQTAFNEYTTIDTYPTPGGPLPTGVLLTSEDGFVDSDPTVAPTMTFCGPIFVDCGPSDHGAQFDLDIGGLAPGASKTFKIYYGAAPSEPAALAALGVVNAQFYSFGQPNLSPPDHGRPNTFIFAFGGSLFAPGCTGAPQNMVLWLPFDEGSGLTTDNLKHNTADGTVTGGAWLGTSGKVIKAVCFDQGQVTVPHYAALYLNADLSMDAWVKPLWIQGPGWKYTLVDKRTLSSPAWRGYWLYLNGTTGALTLEFNDGVGPPIVAVGPNLPLTNTWEHVAVAVRRNCAGGGSVCVDFWHNGVASPTLTFFGQGGTMGTTNGVRVGDDLDPGTGNNWTVGCIDEVEIFNRALVSADVKAIYDAGFSGKCKEFCVPTVNGVFYDAQTSIVVPYQVCNYTNTVQCYNLSFLSATCTPPGIASPVGITTSPSSPICVPPGGCSTVWLTIPRPPFTAFGQISCYTGCMTNISTGDVTCCDGSVALASSIVIDWPPIDGPIVIGTAVDFGPIGVALDGPGSPGHPLGIRIRAIGPDMEPDTVALSLNGLPPGVPWEEWFKIQPGVVVQVPIEVTMVIDDPTQIYRILLEADLDGDGQYDTLESRVVIGRLSSEGCEPAEDEDFEFHPPGTVCGLSGFIPWQNGNDVCGEVSTAQASSGNRSLKIVGSVGGAGGLGDDTVLPVAGVTSGQWTVRAMTFVPSDATGEGALVLLNTYDDVNPPQNSWYSAQVRFRANQNQLVADVGAGTTPLIKGQWVELRLEIDLDSDLADYFYNGAQFVTDRPWTDGVVPGFPGPARLRALDFYGGEPSTGGTSGMYFDDVTIKPVCVPGGGGNDCNENGVADSTDIAKGTSLDCYSAKAGHGGAPDGVPDECQCVTDWNLDGFSNSADVGEFINTYFSDQAFGQSNGDINCDGVSNSTDVGEFINLWFAAQAGLLPFSGCTI